MSGAKRILPHTPWMASLPWTIQAKPIAMLLFALSLFGIGEGMLVLANLGSTPWTVLAQGIAIHTGLALGMVTFLISAGVMLLWIPLRLTPGLGTLLNMSVIAVVLQLFLNWVTIPSTLVWRYAFCVAGVVMIGVASTLYLTCHMGAGPRDGLMVGLCQKTGWRVGIVRTSIEVIVCAVGWLLGGTLGLGTLLFAFCVGWVVQITLRLLAKRYQQA